jgi:hypothetical protein
MVVLIGSMRLSAVFTSLVRDEKWLVSFVTTVDVCLHNGSNACFTSVSDTLAEADSRLHLTARGFIKRTTSYCIEKCVYSNITITVLDHIYRLVVYFWIMSRIVIVVLI